MLARRGRRDSAELQGDERVPNPQAEHKPCMDSEMLGENVPTEGRMKQSPEEEEVLEREHFWKIINTFSCYGAQSHERVNRTESQFKSLPKNQQNMLPNFLFNLDSVRKCIDHNQEVLKMVVNDCTSMFENKEYGINGHRKATPASTFDMDKLKSTIKQFVRDWSDDGKLERDSCYQPIIDQILQSYPRDECDVSKIKILVPGAGLGRLAWEIAKHGYSCQGNEWSFFMLFSSNFVLNRCSDINAFKLYPWIHQFSNNRRSVDQIRPVYFPDVNPQSLPADSNFSMTAGDFQEIYTDNGSWDCIATCFFIDTAHNVLNYIETIWKILKPGGLWINLDDAVRYQHTASYLLHYYQHWISEGPLLYHFENMANELSIEMSYEDLKSVILQYGFQMEYLSSVILRPANFSRFKLGKRGHDTIRITYNAPKKGVSFRLPDWAVNDWPPHRTCLMAFLVLFPLNPPENHVIGRIEGKSDGTGFCDLNVHCK